MAAVGTGVTVGSHTVRVLQVKRQKDGTWQVTRALTHKMQGDDPSQSQRVSEARALLQTADCKGNALVGLSGRELIVRYTQVPPVPDWRLEMLMNFEIQEVSEQSGGDVSAAYSLLEVDDTTTGDNVVLVALAKNGYLKPRLGALKAAGLKELGGTPNAVGAFHAYKENGHLRHDETVLIMHIGHENTDVAIAREGNLLFARNVSGGSNKFTEALMSNMRVPYATAEKMKIKKGNLMPRGRAKYRDSAEEKIANNLMGVGGHFVSAFNSSVMFAKAQTKVPDCAPDRMVLMGGGGQLRGLPEYLESNLGVPVELFDPFEDVDLSALPSDAADALRQDRGAMGTVLGIAQLAADDEVDRVAVLPAETKKAREFTEKTLLVIAAAAILAIAVTVSFVMLGSAHDAAAEDEARLKDIGSQYDANKADFERAQTRVKALNHEKFLVRTRGALGPAALEIVGDVQTAITEGEFDEIYITKVVANRKVVVVGEVAGGGKVREMRPEIVFTANVKQRGDRTAGQAYADFNSRLKAIVKGKGYLDHSEVAGGLKGDKFEFRIVQVQFPEKFEAAKADAATDGEGS